MISLPLLKRNMSQIWKILLILLAAMTLYTTVIIYMYDPELAHMLNDYQIALPGIMSAVGMTGIAGNLTEFVYIYLYGFIMLVFPIIAIIILGNKLLAHYIDSGSMGILLATPNSRLKILLTQLLSMLAGITLLIVLITAIGVGTCEGLFPGELDIPLFLKLNAALLLFHLMLGGIAFLPACIFNDSKWYFSIGAGLLVLFFLFQMLGNTGGDMEFFRYLTPFTLFPGKNIVDGDGEVLLKFLGMAGAAIVMYGCGAVCFHKKDLPL